MTYDTLMLKITVKISFYRFLSLVSLCFIYKLPVTNEKLLVSNIAY